ncbi:MAG: hypothetical protein MUP82_00950 [Candidatus Marinimicrobia bacterium]|nr:hypothetical protein [Candidatus Neomarinimicrobiota bacterium]
MFNLLAGERKPNNKGDVLVVTPTGLFSQYNEDIEKNIPAIHRVDCTDDYVSTYRRYMKNKDGKPPTQPLANTPGFKIKAIEYRYLNPLHAKYDEKVLELKELFNDKIVVFDEAHRLFRPIDVCDPNSSIIEKYVLDGILDGAKKIIFMTGTPIKKGMTDLIQMMNILKPPLAPTNPRAFDIYNNPKAVTNYLQSESLELASGFLLRSSIRRWCNCIAYLFHRKDAVPNSGSFWNFSQNYIKSESILFSKYRTEYFTGWFNWFKTLPPGTSQMQNPALRYNNGGGRKITKRVKDSKKKTKTRKNRIMIGGTEYDDALQTLGLQETGELNENVITEKFREILIEKGLQTTDVKDDEFIKLNKAYNFLKDDILINNMKGVVPFYRDQLGDLNEDDKKKIQMIIENLKPILGDDNGVKESICLFDDIIDEDSYTVVSKLNEMLEIIRSMSLNDLKKMIDTCNFTNEDSKDTKRAQEELKKEYKARIDLAEAIVKEADKEKEEEANKEKEAISSQDAGKKKYVGGDGGSDEVTEQMRKKIQEIIAKNITKEELLKIIEGLQKIQQGGSNSYNQRGGTIISKLLTATIALLAIVSGTTEGTPGLSLTTGYNGNSSPEGMLNILAEYGSLQGNLPQTIEDSNLAGQLSKLNGDVNLAEGEITTVIEEEIKTVIEEEKKDVMEEEKKDVIKEEGGDKAYLFSILNSILGNTITLTTTGIATFLAVGFAYKSGASGTWYRGLQVTYNAISLWASSMFRFRTGYVVYNSANILAKMARARFYSDRSGMILAQREYVKQGLDGMLNVDKFVEDAEKLISTISTNMPSIVETRYEYAKQTNLYVLRKVYHEGKLTSDAANNKYPTRELQTHLIFYSPFQLLVNFQMNALKKTIGGDKRAEVIHNNLPWFFNRKNVLDSRFISNCSPSILCTDGMLKDKTKSIVYFDFSKGDYVENLKEPLTNIANKYNQFYKDATQPDMYECEKFKKILRNLLIMKTGYMLQERSRNDTAEDKYTGYIKPVTGKQDDEAPKPAFKPYKLVPQAHFTWDDQKYTPVESVHTFPTPSTEKETVLRYFLPFVYSTSDSLGLNLFAMYLQKFKIKYTCLHDIDPSYNAQIKNSIKTAYKVNIIDNSLQEDREDLWKKWIETYVFDTNYYSTKNMLEAFYKVFGDDDAKDPICVLLHPFKTEGIDGKYNPAIILMEPALDFGDYEQLCGRVLRSYNNNYATKPYKMVYQCLTASLSSFDTFIKAGVGTLTDIGSTLPSEYNFLKDYFVSSIHNVPSIIPDKYSTKNTKIETFTERPSFLFEYYDQLIKYISTSNYIEIKIPDLVNTNIVSMLTFITNEYKDLTQNSSIVSHDLSIYTAKLQNIYNLYISAVNTDTSYQIEMNNNNFNDTQLPKWKQKYSEKYKKECSFFLLQASSMFIKSAINTGRDTQTLTDINITTLNTLLQYVNTIPCVAPSDILNIGSVFGNYNSFLPGDLSEVFGNMNYEIDMTRRLKYTEYDFTRVVNKLSGIETNVLSAADRKEYKRLTGIGMAERIVYSANAKEIHDKVSNSNSQVVAQGQEGYKKIPELDLILDCAYEYYKKRTKPALPQGNNIDYLELFLPTCDPLTDNRSQTCYALSEKLKNLKTNVDFANLKGLCDAYAKLVIDLPDDAKLGDPANAALLTELTAKKAELNKAIDGFWGNVVDANVVDANVVSVNDDSSNNNSGDDDSGDDSSNNNSGDDDSGKSSQSTNAPPVNQNLDTNKSNLFTFIKGRKDIQPKLTFDTKNDKILWAPTIGGTATTYEFIPTPQNGDCLFTSLAYLIEPYEDIKNTMVKEFAERRGNDNAAGTEWFEKSLALRKKICAWMKQNWAELMTKDRIESLSHGDTYGDLIKCGAPEDSAANFKDYINSDDFKKLYLDGPDKLVQGECTYKGMCNSPTWGEEIQIYAFVMMRNEENQDKQTIVKAVTLDGNSMTVIRDETLTTSGKEEKVLNIGYNRLHYEILIPYVPPPPAAKPPPPAAKPPPPSTPPPAAKPPPPNSVKASSSPPPPLPKVPLRGKGGNNSRKRRSNVPTKIESWGK